MSLDRARLLVGEALWSPGTGLLRPAGGAAVALDSDGNAVEHGPASEVRDKHEGLEVDEGPGLLMPGLVDAHVHLECAVLADQVPGGVGMAGWVARLLQVRASYTMEQTEAAGLAAARQMRALGTVAIGDICTILTTAPLLAEAGLLGVSLLEIFAASDEGGVVALEGARARMKAAPASELIDVRIVPHSPYGTPASVIRALRGGGAEGRLLADADAASDARAEAAAAGAALTSDADPSHGADELPGLYAAGLALEGGLPDLPSGEWRAPAVGVRSIHAAEHVDELDWVVSGEGAFAKVLRSMGGVSPGQTPIRYLDSLGAIGSETLLVHMVVASAEELSIAAARGATAVLCPRSNLHIGGELPDLPAIRAAGLPYVLGTDSLASTPDHDLLGEVRTLARAFPQVPIGELLAAATVGGAAALGLRDHPWVRIDAERIPELFEAGAR